jgi:hypothetical protein
VLIKDLIKTAVVVGVAGGAAAYSRFRRELA